MTGINAKKISIVFRVDSGELVGSGHLMRCLTLAQSCFHDGHSVHFICRNHPGSMHKKIEDHLFEVTLLNRPPLAPSLTTPSKKYADFLGVSQISDAASCRAVKALKSADVVIVDHYGLDQEWEAALNLEPHQILVAIDDLADRNHICNILLDQNYYKTSLDRYKGRVPKDAQLLLGPKFALVRPQFCAAIKQREPMAETEPFRILVAFGGLDLQAYGLKTVKALLEHFTDSNVICMLMGIYTLPAFQPELAELKTNYPNNLEILGYSEMPWHHMADCHLYVGAGGSISWERFVLGLPGIVYAISDNQFEVSGDLGRAGYQVFLGSIRDFSASALVTSVSKFRTDRPWSQLMSAQSSLLVDGLGVERVENFIVCESIKKQK